MKLNWRPIRIHIYTGLLLIAFIKLNDLNITNHNPSDIIWIFIMIILFPILYLEYNSIAEEQRKQEKMNNKLTRDYIISKGFTDNNDRGMSENNGSELISPNFNIRFWDGMYPRLKITHIHLGVVLETGNRDEITKDDFDNIIKILGI